VLGVAAVPILGIILFFGSGLLSSDSGSVTTASEFEAALSAVATPRDAERLDPPAQVHRFPSGEWAAVLVSNSHGGLFSGGGTVVVRDSTGRVTWFYGHVCGDGGGPTSENCPTLAEFYDRFGMGFKPLARPAPVPPS
jgi:hypothetical protein